MPGQGFVVSYYYVKPPSMWTGYAPANSATWQSDSFGRILGRHTNGISNTALADGHAKGFRLGELHNQDLWHANKSPAFPQYGG